MDCFALTRDIPASWGVIVILVTYDAVSLEGSRTRNLQYVRGEPVVFLIPVSLLVSVYGRIGWSATIVRLVPVRARHLDPPHVTNVDDAPIPCVAASRGTGRAESVPSGPRITLTGVVNTRTETATSNIVAYRFFSSAHTAILVRIPVFQYCGPVVNDTSVLAESLISICVTIQAELWRVAVEPVYFVLTVGVVVIACPLRGRWIPRT
mmetsp:Transcript_39649/g.77533  ORF Transcript_39649/g.77533 Transcript_39649/m.77533 type:complete len:208 (-) Transcript_39649:857-1480(-)